jgi:tetratricopeptide (TPR) repeat protein
MNAKDRKLIDDYLSDKMDEKATAVLKARLKKDSDLKCELELQQGINDAIQQKDVTAFTGKIQRIHQLGNKKKKVSKVVFLVRQNPLRTASIAATFLILISIGGFLISGAGTGKSGTKLFSNYYQADDAIMMVRSGSNPADIDLKEALLAYNEKKYDNAIKLLKNQSNNILAQYYLGLSYLETDKLDKAIETFQHIIDHKFNLFIEQAEWYLSLCYLKTSQEGKAILLLEKISNSNSIFKEKSEKILKQI